VNTFSKAGFFFTVTACKRVTFLHAQ